MSRRKEPFVPRHPDQVQMYVCGVTVYDLSHIGHARVYVAFDLLYRLLASPALQYSVQYVRNFTDVDDKIIMRAAQHGEDPLQLAGRFILEFHEDMARLNCLPPTCEPRATDYIPHMVESIQRIMSNGHAYVVAAVPGSEPGSSDVYFDVCTLPGYGALSGRQQADNRAGERVSVDERKRGPADFALWKAAKPGEPSWPSPWGPGRPGWHIECSAMINSILGPTIDIHGGGRDLVFPHHENELAQARAMLGVEPAPDGVAARDCGCGLPHPAQHDEAVMPSTSGQQESPALPPLDQRQFVRYWLHNGFVNVDSEKMSKSLGNFFTIRDVLQSYHALALRWFLVSTHYRAPVNYSSRALDEASDRLYYVYQALVDALDVLLTAPGSHTSAAGEAPPPQSPLQAAVYASLLDDLNSPTALAELSAPLKSINDLVATKAGRKRPDRLQQLSLLVSSIASVLSLLGLLTLDSSGWQAGPAKWQELRVRLQCTLTELRKLFLSRSGLSEDFVQQRIQARAAARTAKDFATADAVRIELASQGVAIMDTPEGTTWRPCMPSA